MTDDMLAAALAYAREGLPIFPIRPLGKKPLYEGSFYQATTDAAKIKEWWQENPGANIGVSPGAAGMLVIDIDPGADLGELERAVEGLPPTRLRQKTPRGGEHRFYALAEGEEVRPTASQIATNVDVRSAGSYILLPPSYVVDPAKGIDGGYAWVEETWPRPKPAFRTDAMIRACGQKRQKSANADVWLIDPDMPENIEAAIRWIESDKCRPSIEGQGGDKAAYDTAAMMRSFGLSESVATELLHEFYNAKATPAWDMDDLAIKVRNAYAYATSAPGNMTDAYRKARVAQLFKPAQKATANGGWSVSAGGHLFVDRVALKELPAPEWLIPDLLTVGGSALLVAPPGSFKTFLALDWALSLAVGPGAGQGRLWPDIPKAGPVLIAVGEGLSGLQPRIAAWEAHHNGGAEALDLVVASPVPSVAAGAEAWDGFIATAKLRHPSYAMVIVDTVGRAMQGRNINTQEDAGMFTALVQKLQAGLGAEDRPCSVLALAHTGQNDKSRMGGSVMFEADADTVIVLERQGKSPHVSMTMRKQKDAPEWDQPVTAHMIAVGDTLVATKQAKAAPKPAEAPAAPAQPKAELFKPTPAVMSVLDKEVEAVLRTNPSRAWTTRELAEAVAMRPGVEIPSDKLNRVELKNLREKKDTLANRSYDPATKRWRAR